MKRLFVNQVINPEWNPEPGTPQHVYQVAKVTNSTTPQIRDQLNKEQLDLYCDDDDWEVSIS